MVLSEGGALDYEYEYEDCLLGVRCVGVEMMIGVYALVIRHSVKGNV